MGNHPIEALMKTAMESIQQIVDVNTIVGDPVETHDGSVIIPVSRVACGFAAGGSEFLPADEQGQDQGNGGEQGGNALPFGGGSGGGVSVQPVGFLVVGNGQVRLLPVDSNAVVERIIDTVPDLIDKVSGLFKKKRDDEDDLGIEDT
ncbi:Sporulation protein YtfJ (Spore_YtfJ) [Acididesulfobacillus acetoxydans]|uniref:Spore_ytfJ: sporulation protein YtfJ n=1 Tax=Acididesulfobacillus acetoxydans TaxID=1561005 RepID=A0A8S0X5Z0_9FIRM|nr:GerW family sporulation protein [Acididesulfobacillus acetoxydans]CAA7602060.1 Sporulation protein YtfJ (Spore_YtfJ) [Acididesulfobacillus acetoxydans]CEJ08097.1 spore_ytfJ: sporulation protein YtfJ [Acididesulfobacillus acetoxydans]